MEPSLIDVNIYCDESRYSNNEDPYLVIGAVKCLRYKKPEIVNALTEIKRAHGIGGEFGWKTVSSNKEDFYKAVLRWFANCDDLLFRCVVANKRHLWSRDDEGGFYVVYHQLLFHWFSQGCSYHVFLDRKKNSNRRRVDQLRYKTKRDTPSGCVLECMEEVESDECVLVQLADLLIGCVGYKWNGRDDNDRYPMASPFKAELCSYLAKMLNRPSLKLATGPGESKFNVFNFGE